MKTFGETIKEARESQGLILRKVAAALDIDQATISKLERGERKPTKDQVEQFAKFYGLDRASLITSWLSDTIAYSIMDEDNAEEVLKVAEEKIKYLKDTHNGR